MTQLAMQVLNGLVYLGGAMVGLSFRYADWRDKQPETVDRSVARWRRVRLGSIIRAAGLAVVLTLVVVDGRLILKIPYVGDLVGSVAAIVLAGPIGMFLTYLSHYWFAWGKRNAEKAAGGPVNDD